MIQFRTLRDKKGRERVKRRVRKNKREGKEMGRKGQESGRKWSERNRKLRDWKGAGQWPKRGRKETAKGGRYGRGQKRDRNWAKWEGKEEKRQ
jgi:hypothetical protein